MEGFIRQLIGLIQQGIEMIVQLLELAWSWSFGQIVSILRSDIQALPIWKIVVLVIAVIIIAYLLYRVAREIWNSVRSLLKSFIDLLVAFIGVLPYLVGAGAVAFAASWVINTLNF